MNKSKEIIALMSRAAENLEVGFKLLKDKHYEISASRLYYAMFYAAEAALLHRDLQFSKHSAVIGRFNREFIKSGVLESSIFKSFQKAFELRNEADYGISLTEEKDVKSVAKEAEFFFSAVCKYLEKEGYELNEIKEE
jgi:uncharacterized protein (UPF0332 family)